MLVQFDSSFFTFMLMLAMESVYSETKKVSCTIGFATWLDLREPHHISMGGYLKHYPPEHDP